MMESADDFLLAFRFTDRQDLEDRLAQLAAEWDLDRASALLFAGLGMLALPLARLRGGWIAPAALQALALLRLIGIGPNPFSFLLRPMGFRPRAAIDVESAVVRSLRETPEPAEAPQAATQPPTPTPFAGEELRPMDAPTVSGPSGEWPPRGDLR